ncbi:hypothetical protein D3C86_1823920 [compost metagenome]
MAQGLTGAFTHQPGRRDKTLQRPVVPAKHGDALVQAGEGGLPGQAVKLTFVGIDPAHEPVSRIVHRRSVITMEIAVQRQFVAALDSFFKPLTKVRVVAQVVVLVEVRHHEPGDGYVAQCIHGVDKGLVIGPGLRCYIVQDQ